MTTNGARQEPAKSVSLYLTEPVIEKINFFAEKTVRSKSQAAEYLIRLGLDRFVETSVEDPDDAPKLTRKRTPAKKRSIKNVKPETVKRRRAKKVTSA